MSPQGPRPLCSLRNVLLLLGVAGLAALLVSPALQAQTGKPDDKKGLATGTKLPGVKEPVKPVVPKTPSVVDIMVAGSGTEQVALINQTFEKLWEANKLEEADRCSDYAFIRRASLDLIGRIAKLEELQQFMNDSPQKRRSQLIERLLASDEFANNFANIWTTLLLTRSAPKMQREQMHLWLFDQFDKKDASWKDITSQLITAKGRTNENGAVNYILMHLGEEIRENRDEMGRFDMVPITSRTTKLFLGLRTQCTQCHDHPFNDEWRQQHFWGVNSFFRQVDAPSGRPMMGANRMMNQGGQFELTENASFNTDGTVPFERRNGVLLYTTATFLDGTKLPAAAKNSRREELAKQITKNSYFPKAFINRTWAHFFGKGMTKDGYDDFGEHNPAVSPALLEKLAEDWSSRYGHNPRDLIRWICNSKPYGLSSVANKTNQGADTEIYFSRMLLKAMSPEQLYESLNTATQSKASSNKEDRKKMREEWLKKLVVSFGDDEGNEITFNGTVIQALELMNGKDINEAINDTTYGTVANVLKKKGIAALPALNDLYLAALNRLPTEREAKRILSNEMVNFPRIPNQKRDQEFWTAFYQDIFWAILNSNEFFLNH